MEASEAVEREVNKILLKFDGISNHTSQTLEDLIRYLDVIRSELSEGNDDAEISPTQNLIISQSCKKIKDTINQISTEHKDLHSSVSKVGKSIDRNFVSDVGVIMQDTFLTEDKMHRINSVICEHFLRQGMLDTAEELIEETGMDVDEKDKEPFLELHRILESLKNKNPELALEWAQRNREKLQVKNSSLEFKLHRLKFIDLIRHGPSRQLELLLYAKNFAPFAISHTKDLQVLMGSLLFVNHGLETSPYAFLLDPILWEDICDLFTRDACALLGLSVESPLSVSIQAGCAALPPLLNIKQVMMKRQCSNVWSSKDELPVEIDLGPDMRYHSTFACPILRQQSTESNPPVRLVCGHVISRDALNKLANGNKFKCPYCPVEQNVSDARQIFF